MLLNFELIMEEEIIFEEDEELNQKKSPLRYILGIFLILLIVVMIIPLYGIKIDPQPERIPSIEEVFLFENNDTICNEWTFYTDFFKSVWKTNPYLL